MYKLGSQLKQASLQRRTAKTKIDKEAIELYSPTLLRVLAHRGVQTRQELEYTLNHLPHFEGLKDINKAAGRIAQAILQDELICIVGDFDADGATSVALLVRAFRAMGAYQVTYQVPNRFTDGYGLSAELVEQSAKAGIKLIITVDNGMGSFEAVECANQLGIDVIITDHHLAAETLPNAYCIVNPNQPDCAFESKSLAGVGVAFYVLIALRHWFKTQQPDHQAAHVNLAQWLDLVAVGTIADVVPLDYVNRILVAQGISRMHHDRVSYGIKALADVSSRDIKTLQANDIGFTLGPRINAAGRLDDMNLGIECLLADDVTTAWEKAEALQALNNQRRHVEQNMREQASDLLNEIIFDEVEIPPIICLYQANWHSGVVGIVAGRLKEKYHRPVIVFACETVDETLDETAADTATKLIKGSGRSIPGIHLRDLLERVSHIAPHAIERFGGHAMAAGLTLQAQNYDVFHEALLVAAKQMIKPSVFEPIIWTDGELSPQDFNLHFLQEIKRAGPWGQAFPEPVFDGEFRVLDARWLKEVHLKLRLEVPGQSSPVDAIAFFVNQAAWEYTDTEHVKIAYRLSENTFRDKTSLQLMIEYLWPLNP